MKGNLHEIATARITTATSSLRNKDPWPCLPFLLQLPNLLALDAAFFAFCWQWMATTAFGFEFSWIHGVLVATAVWLGYTADRWLDVCGMRNSPKTRRHRFMAQHRGTILIAWAGVLSCSMLISWKVLRVEEFSAGLALAGMCATNAWINHADPNGRLPLPKEVRAALLLSAGIHLFLWRSMAETSFSLCLSFVSVTTLCFLNCCFVAKWETKVDRSQGQSSLPLRRKKVGFLSVKVTIATIGLCSSIALLRIREPEALVLFCSAIALASLPFIDRLKLDAEDKRVLADASLFLPCLSLI